ncbi:MAG: hypothetical protein LV481_02500 [Methylacidiphilales bacterium]|nr:hypothetical protein [Candidatus Methylacidiphilales bacterium]
MMAEIVLLIGLFGFILGMITMLGSFFSKQWPLFAAMLAGVMLSAACVIVVLFGWLCPTTSHELPPVVIVQPVVPT